MTTPKKRSVHIVVDKMVDDAISDIVYIKRRHMEERATTRRAAVSFAVIETASRLRQQYMPEIKG